MSGPALHPSERARAPWRWPAWMMVLATIAAIVVAGSALAAQVMLRSLAATGTTRVAVGDMPFSIREADRATGMAARSIAAPGAGTTGTAVLPPLPAGIVDAAVPASGSVVAARPFAVAGSSTQDRGRAMECLTAAVYYEAASEPDDGQRAVAQVVLNRVRHPAFPATVCGVVYQGSERDRCQFSFACDGAMARATSRSGWARAARVAAAALAGYVYAPVGLATHYHTYAVTPAWNRTLVMTDAIGAHFFHRWKGFWGTSAAFVQRYAGGEPVPGPHLRLDLPVMAAAGTAAPPIAVAGTAIAVTKMMVLPGGRPTENSGAPIMGAPDVQPTYRDSGQPIAPERSDQGSQILDRWKDSGTAIH